MGGRVIPGNLRIYVLTVFIFLIFAAVIFRLYALQVAAYEFYKNLADNQHTLFRQLVPERGEIFMNDKNGLFPAAVNRLTKMAYVVPREVENRETAADFISGTLDLDKAEVEKKLEDENDMYEPLKHRLTGEEIGRIENSKIKGLHLSEETYRYYPSGELGAGFLGFFGWKDKEQAGRYGLEAYYEKELRGRDGQMLQDKDTAGRWISTGAREIVGAEDGEDLVLTVDHIIQYEAEKILESAVEKNQADGGSIIVLEPSSGRILALANFPTFDPNNYSKVDNIDIFRNASVSIPYECGSVFKTISLAAAIDAGKINANTTYNDSGAVNEAGYTIKNSDEKAYGLQTMTQVLEKSLNTGAIFAEKNLGNIQFAEYVRKFGFGELTGVDLYSESPGNIHNLDNPKININFYTASFGQGMTVTPIQLLNSYAAIANGGVLMKPQIVEKFIGAGGNEKVNEPQEIRRVISPQTAYEVSQMLRSVVTEGHGKRADVPGYLVAGKTGTAQVASTTSKGYEEGKAIGSFTGFAPLDDPKFAILVKIDNPKGIQWAESSAAPAFGELMKFVLEYAGIAPTEKYTQTQMDIFNQTHNLNELFLKKPEEKQPENKKIKNPSGNNNIKSNG